MSKKKKKFNINKYQKRKEKSLFENDILDAPDPERRRIYLEGSLKRLKEYAENIKRDKNDPKYESDNNERM